MTDAHDQLCHADADFDRLIRQALANDARILRAHGATAAELADFLADQRQRYAEDKTRAMTEVSAFLLDATFHAGPARTQ